MMQNDGLPLPEDIPEAIALAVWVLVHEDGTVEVQEPELLLPAVDGEWHLAAGVFGRRRVYLWEGVRDESAHE